MGCAAPDSSVAERPIRVRQTPSTFHRRAQRNAFRCPDARQQSRTFARWNQSLALKNALTGRVVELCGRACRFRISIAGVAELADALDSKTNVTLGSALPIDTALTVSAKPRPSLRI